MDSIWPELLPRIARRSKLSRLRLSMDPIWQRRSVGARDAEQSFSSCRVWLLRISLSHRSERSWQVKLLAPLTPQRIVSSESSLQHCRVQCVKSLVILYLPQCLGLTQCCAHLTALARLTKLDTVAQSEPAEESRRLLHCRLLAEG
jgi:hypothetical protein